MAGTLSELASFPDSRLRILNAENGLLIMIESLDRVLAHYGVAAFAGVMSACFAFGVEAGDGLQKAAAQLGAQTVYANNAPLLLVLMGGGISNIVWCVILNVRNGSKRDYLNFSAPLSLNYFFCALAGIIAYAEFFFFGMGESQMGRYSVFASWPIHMAFIIAFSNMWGILFHEWKGTSVRTRVLLTMGLILLVGSTVVSSSGSLLDQQGASEQVASTETH